MSSPIVLTVKGDMKAIARDLAQLPDKEIKRAGVLAINRAGTKVRSVAVKDLSSDLRVKQKIIRAKSRLLKANKRKLHATIIGYLGPIPAEDAGGAVRDRRPKGVTVGRRRFPKAFIARNVRSRYTVWERAFKGGRVASGIGTFTTAGRVKRLPLMLATIPVAYAGRRAFQNAFDKYARSTFSKEFTRQLRWRLSRRRA